MFDPRPKPSSPTLLPKGRREISLPNVWRKLQPDSTFLIREVCQSPPKGRKKPGILDSRTILFYYSISLGLLRRSFLCLQRAQFVAITIGREVFVIAPLYRLVYVAATN